MHGRFRRARRADRRFESIRFAYEPRAGLPAIRGTLQCGVCATLRARVFCLSMTRKPSPHRAAPSQRSRDNRLSMLHLAPESLGFALDCAAQAVGAVRQGAALPAALQAILVSLPESVATASRGAVQDIAYRTMRRLGTAEWLVAKLVRKAPPPHIAHVLACA